MAFTLSKLNGAEPTIDYLNDMERKEYTNKKTVKEIPSKSRINLPDMSDNLKIYNHSSQVDETREENNLMESYMCRTPKVIT